MSGRTLQVHPQDDVLVALEDLPAGAWIEHGNQKLQVLQPIAAKHKLATRDLAVGDHLKMYGQVVGEVRQAIARGGPVTTGNVVHAIGAVDVPSERFTWQAPNVDRWRNSTFDGFHRADGKVGTGNYWIVIPLVFCQNRNLQMLGDALADELGYGRAGRIRHQARWLVDQHRQGTPAERLMGLSWDELPADEQRRQIFPNVDGIKLLRHEGGCGCTYEDAINLCRLFAGYIHNPNVAGATVLSLGCQKSEIRTLEEELQRLDPQSTKPVYIFDQQKIGTEQTLVFEAMKHTLAGVALANRQQRAPAKLDQLVLGVECGGSDGFSGISANPAMGHTADLLVALGGTVVLTEFPELAGCESDLMWRCERPELAERFLQLMQEYDRRAQLLGGGFHQNPSPGNIRDGLITDAMKSAGAARKGGTSPVVDVLDYPEVIRRHGLNLLCTPGGDIESTTAIAGAGGTVQIFSTGLGTPTGNPINPMIKVSTNTPLAQRMPDIIDLDAGTIVTGEETIEQVGERLLDLVIEVASGRYVTKAQRLGQDDFMPWRRGMSF
ncbi:MAG: altronate dehydratase family protein [Pirellulales bacterium]